ncbi:HPr family phosphocarrier protein [Marinivivus vitaminiproducens]|uniref:HPr family phosphocarrier protein n=1 Tax=Marinivivus vitaminiproducens TaxID=3035935 RepID=UPI00279E99F8|nr:HPr family phosphocarrier protein [Geminicoccaceae bacterium SCSIO 64248]
MSAHALGQVVVTHKIGLHARPAVKFIRLAKSFEATVRVRAGDEGDWADGKSIVKILSLKVREGADLRLQAEGDDAEAAIQALIDLVRRDFDEPVHG